MGKTSNSTKDKWNKSHYVQVKIRVSPEVAAAFKAVCEANSMSISGTLSKFMEERCGKIPTINNPGKDLFSTRGGRRKLMDAIIRQLEDIKDAEEQYLEAIPANLQGSTRYDAAEQCISEIEEALDSLGRAF